MLFLSEKARRDLRSASIALNVATSLLALSVALNVIAAVARALGK